MAQLGDEALHAREHPAIELGLGADRQRLAGRHPAVGARVGDQEVVGVPQRQDRGLDHVADDQALLVVLVATKAHRLGPHDRARDQVGPQRVGPEALDHAHRVGVVLEPLGHLLAVGGEDQPVDDHVLERWPAKERGREHVQRVEPAAGLIEALGDEVGREVALDVVLLARVEGVVVLRVGHRARFEPAVEDLLDPTHRAARGLGRGEAELVDALAVQVGQRAGFEPTQAFELGDRTDADHVAGVLVAAPDRQRRAPIAVAREVPVAGCGQPIAKARAADPLGHPVDLGVVGQQVVVHVLDPHEPGRDRHVQERLVGPVAVRVRVLERVAVDQRVLALEPLDDRGIGRLRSHPGELADARVEHAVEVHRPDDRQALALAGLEVVFAVRGRLVDDPGAGVGGHVLGRDDPERDVGVLGEVGEERRVADPDQLGAHAPLHDLGLADALAGLVVGQPPRLDPRQLARREHANLHVLDLGVDGQREVARQRPRGRRPGPERLVLGPEDLEADRDAWILAELVALFAGRRVLLLRALRDLEVGQGGAEQGRDRLDSIALVDPSGRPQPGEHPPDALHERGVHGLVVVVEVDPATHALDDLAPFFGVAKHARAAGRVELGHAERLDLDPAVDVELVLDQALDRQPVAVPAEAALDRVALHRPVAGHDVLDRAREQVAVVGQTGRERGPVVEHEGRLGLDLGLALTGPVAM